MNLKVTSLLVFMSIFFSNIASAQRSDAIDMVRELEKTMVYDYRYIANVIDHRTSKVDNKDTHPYFSRIQFNQMILDFKHKQEGNVSTSRYKEQIKEKEKLELAEHGKACKLAKVAKDPRDGADFNRFCKNGEYKLEDFNAKYPEEKKKSVEDFALTDYIEKERYDTLGSDLYNKIERYTEGHNNLDSLLSSASSECEWVEDLPRKVISVPSSCNSRFPSKACVGHVICTDPTKNNLKFIKVVTCSDTNCGENSAEACRKEPNYSSKDPSDSGASEVSEEINNAIKAKRQ